MVNKHSAEVLSEGCLLSKCKPGRGLHRLLANNLKKNGQNISKFISFKDEPEACGNQLLFLLASVLYPPFVLWTYSHSSGTSIVVSLSPQR